MWKKNDLGTIQGLSSYDVEQRLQQFGYNELPSSEKRGFWKIVLDVLREPMFLLLCTCGIIYCLLGDIQEALMLLGFVFIIIGITIKQERKSERALESLRDLSSPRALVIRDGIPKRIPGREVVQDDDLLLKEGDRVPADGIVISCTNLAVDESLLTGESAPVRKSCNKEKKVVFVPPGGDDLPFVYSGTLVVQGQAIVKVLQTGIHTEMGKIGKAIRSIEPQNTFIQKETARLVKNLAIIGTFFCISLVLGYGFVRHDWAKGILAGLTLAMAMLPEEFPVVLTIFLALGAWRISQKKVLTRQVSAIETLGASTVLCVDKTGTITENQMTVVQIACKDEFWSAKYMGTTEFSETFHPTVEFGILASQKEPFDPMEKALQKLGHQFLANTEHLHEDWALIQEYPLSKNLLAVSHVWQSPDKKEFIIATKGAPEAIADLCHLSDDETQQILAKTSLMAQEGLRVLGVARAVFPSTILPSEQHDFIYEFLGLIGLHDPVRPSVASAIQECYQAGIRVVMITGDYSITAQNIAEQIGLRNVTQIITGTELQKMSQEKLLEKIREVNIFARVVPEQKLQIVENFKKLGEIVAMTGDGVNDAPSLKSAHIGIAMGGRGTDVARESSDLVLLEDDFSSIVQAVKMGRRIFDNLQKAMAYILAVHVPIAGMSLLPILGTDFPLILLPMHVVFLELVIDPSCSIVFEAEKEEKNVMLRPPRNPQQALFGTKQIVISLLQGLGVLFMVILVFYVAKQYDPSDEYVRSCTFVSLIFSNLCLIAVNRSFETRQYNPTLLWVIFGALAFLGIVLYVPVIQNIFKLKALGFIELFLCATASIVSVIWFEGYKWYRKKS